MEPFTHLNLLDVEDVAPSHDMGDIVARFATKHLGGGGLGLSLQKLGPGYRMPFGHTHETQEELYVILAGSGRLAVGETLLNVRAMDVVRVVPTVQRAFEAGPDGLELLAFGAPVGEFEAAQQMGWWPEAA